MALLAPKKITFLKHHRGRLSGKKNKTYCLSKNEYIFLAKTASWITAKQIEMLRIILTKKTKKLGTFQILIFPDKPITKRLPESRMGSGKGNVKYWVATVICGMPILKVSLTSINLLNNIFILLNYKLPIKLTLLTYLTNK